MGGWAFWPNELSLEGGLLVFRVPCSGSDGAGDTSVLLKLRSLGSKVQDANVAKPERAEHGRHASSWNLLHIGGEFNAIVESWRRFQRCCTCFTNHIVATCGELEIVAEGADRRLDTRVARISIGRRLVKVVDRLRVSASGLGRLEGHSNFLCKQCHGSPYHLVASI